MRYDSGDVLQPQVCVNIGEVGYKVKLHSVTSQVLRQVMPKGILLSFLILCLQGNPVCDWKTNHNKRISWEEAVCVCVCDKKDGVCVVLLTPSVTSSCLHRLMHLVYLKLQSLLGKKGITAGRENESMSSRRKGFNFHESSVRSVIAVSLCLSSCFSL